jgi:hypothetical protein
MLLLFLHTSQSLAGTGIAVNTGGVLRHGREGREAAPLVHQPPPPATISVEDQALTDLGLSHMQPSLLQKYQYPATFAGMH